MPSVLLQGTSTPVVGVEYTIGPNQNLLTANQASIEQDATGWVAAANCAIAQTVAQAQDGSHSLQMTSSAAGNMTAQTPNPPSAIPVTPGQPYAAVASFRSAVSARSCQVQISWLQPNGAASNISANVTGANVTDGTGGWVQVTAGAVCPADATLAVVIVAVVGTGAGAEVHYVDEIGLYQAGNSTWRYSGAAILVGTNLLSTNQASLETDTSGWLVDTGCTLSRSTAQAWDGVASLALTSTGVGGSPEGMGASLCGGGGNFVALKNTIPVLPNTQYTDFAYFRAATVGRTCQIRIDEYDVTGTTQVHVTRGASITDTTTGWTQATCTVTTQATTYFIAVTVEVAGQANTEVHYVDGVGLVQGSSTTWTRGAGVNGRFSGAATPISIVGYVDCSALAAGEVLFFRVYTTNAAETLSRLAYFGSYVTGSDADPAVFSVPVPMDDSLIFTIQQKNGTARSFPWKIYAL